MEHAQQLRNSHRKRGVRDHLKGTSRWIECLCGRYLLFRATVALLGVCVCLSVLTWTRAPLPVQDSLPKTADNALLSSGYEPLVHDPSGRMALFEVSVPRLAVQSDLLQ